jgi:hypothetical protein
MATRASVDPELAPAFFARLESERQPLLGGVSGTLRFDVVTDDATSCWHITIDHGTVMVHNEPAAADAVARLDASCFEDVVCGRMNAVAAALRGEVAVDGNPRLLNIFQRLFPGPGEASAS